jgi:hypothetical protein
MRNIENDELKISVFSPQQNLIEKKKPTTRAPSLTERLLSILSSIYSHLVPLRSKHHHHTPHS